MRDLQRLPGRKAMENELLREAVSRAAGPGNCCCLRPLRRGMFHDRGRRRARQCPPASVSDAQPTTVTTVAWRSVAQRSLVFRRTGDDRLQRRKVRVAFAFDYCDREAMGHVATAGGITADGGAGLDGGDGRAPLRRGDPRTRAGRVANG